MNPYPLTPKLVTTESEIIHSLTISLTSLALPYKLAVIPSPNTFSSQCLLRRRLQPLRGMSRRRSEREETSESPHLLLGAKEAQVQKSYYVS